jgi:hypothetical protein
VPLAALWGICVALLLGRVYAYALNWIPLIYASVLATALYGMAVGLAVAFGAKQGKMRNPAVATMVGGLVGLLAVYFAWVYDPMARLGIVEGGIWDLETLWEYVKVGYEKGFWSIGDNGPPVTGVFVAAVWIAEAAIIVVCSALMVRVWLGDLPFCEETAQWMTREKKVAQLSLSGDDQAEAKLERLLNGDLTVLGQLVRATGEEPARLQLDLATCPECPTCRFLTVKLIQSVANKKGEVSTQESNLLVNLLITEEEEAAVRSAGIERPVEAPPTTAGAEVSDTT